MPERYELGLFDSTAESWRFDYEKVYPVSNGDAFRAVNAAVAYMLWSVCGTKDFARDEVDGGTKYMLVSSDGVVTDLFVLYLNNNYASVRMNILLPKDRATLEAWLLTHPDVSAVGDTITLYARLFHMCHEEVIKHLHRAVTLEECDPPPPPKNDIEALFTWQEIYRPNMKDAELARIVGIEHQSLRTARSRLGIKKRVLRGKQKAD